MHLNRLHNMEHFQFAGHVIAMCEESAIEKIKAVLEPLKTAVAEEDKALNLPRKQEGTADLEELTACATRPTARCSCSSRCTAVRTT